jgi:thioredoxin reductase (NADPH)
MCFQMGGWARMPQDLYDMVVVGGGPVGLYAGYRGALLHLRVHVVDKGKKWSRGFHVPMYHNLPTHLGGMSGKEVIGMLRKNISQHADFVTIDDFVTIEDVRREGEGFVLEGTHHPSGGKRTYRGRTVALATGVVDRQPIVGGDIRNIFPHANRGLICYCEMCDGHLVYEKNMAVVGSGGLAIHLAEDLLFFGARTVTIITHGEDLLAEASASEGDVELWEELKEKGVKVLTGEIESLFGAEDGYFGARLSSGEELRFDLAFSAMGIHHINNGLALGLEAKVDKDGYVVVDGDCRMLDGDGDVIPGAYAIGDLNYNWNQVMIGFGDADRAVVHAWAEHL